MSVRKKSELRRRQVEVLGDLFGGQTSEEEVLKRHNVSLRVYQRWLCQKEFVEQFSFRIESARRQGQLLIAKYIPAAAAKLVELTMSEKEETSRKACLDILSMPFGDETIAEVVETQDESLSDGLDAGLAGKLLKSLAEEVNDGGE